jgi:hypothetical protein
MNIRFISTIIAMIVVCFAADGCVRAKAPDLPYSSNQKSNLTAGMVKKYVKVGKATQSDLLSVFGAPNIITRDKSGHEVWTYDRQSMASSSEIAAWNAGGTGAAMAGGLAGEAVVGGGAVVGGSTGKSSTAGQISSTTFTLMIYFDEQDVVNDYRMQATQF